MNQELEGERGWTTGRVRPAAFVLAALVLAACSSSQNVSSGQAASEEEAVATEAPTTVPSPTPEPTPQDTSYSDEGIHQILEGSCASCHAPGGPGSESMTLETAGDAVTYANDIGTQTVSLAMPPWPASDLSVAFVDDHSLAAGEVASIKRWVDAGGLIDVEPDTLIVATKPLRSIKDPDLVLTSAKGAYTGSVEVPDDYRCLVFDPELTETQWILASHFEPDQTEVVHHGIISIASEELREQAERMDAAEPGPGWTCYGGHGLSARGGGYEFGIDGWAPGNQPATQPDGYAIPLRPGDFVVVQIHYHYEDETPADLSRMVFDLASEEDLAAVGGEYSTLRRALYLGPAEIPCVEGDTNPLCDRDAALDRLEELFGGIGRALPDVFLRQCGSTPADYAEMTTGVASSSCDLPVRNPGLITSLTGHMHELGASIRLTLNPGEPDETVLLDIPNWNFEWQFGYTPVDDIILKAGDIIRVECGWDRSHGPVEAEGYILWSDGTGDEMCFSSITTAPVT